MQNNGLLILSEEARASMCVVSGLKNTEVEKVYKSKHKNFQITKYIFPVLGAKLFF